MIWVHEIHVFEPQSEMNFQCMIFAVVTASIIYVLLMQRSEFSISGGNR